MLVTSGWNPINMWQNKCKNTKYERTVVTGVWKPGLGWKGCALWGKEWLTWNSRSLQFCTGSITDLWLKGFMMPEASLYAYHENAFQNLNQWLEQTVPILLRGSWSLAGKCLYRSNKSKFSGPLCCPNTFQHVKFRDIMKNLLGIQRTYRTNVDPLEN